jgi:hypothetical protein
MTPGLTEKENDMTTNKKQPAYEVFAVREGTKGRKSHFIKVGTIWPTKTGNGFVQYLDALPVNGKLVLMPPKAKQEAGPETTVDDDGPYIDDEGNFTNPS